VRLLRVVPFDVCCLVILVAAEVAPVPGVPVDTDLLTPIEERVDEIGEVEGDPCGDHLEHLGLHDVDAHADERRDLGLLDESDEPARLLRLDDPVVQAGLPLVHSDGQDETVGQVEVDELPEIERRQDVPVHHEKRLVQALDQRERRWTRHVNPTLAGRTLGILGLGAIGAELARKAAALEMRVIGTKRDGAPVPHVERVYRPAETDTVLAAADYVVLLLPSTAETRGLMDAARLARMKRSAHVLNFGRGDLVVADDLVAAVRGGVIAGAVLDVFVTEPLPVDSPLWTTDGIIVFPHVGGLHPERDDIVAELWVDNLRRFAEDRPLREVVDRARGY